jgi:hypothetical protein
MPEAGTTRGPTAIVPPWSPRSIPAKILTNVDLPDPFAPTRA